MAVFEKRETDHDQVIIAQTARRITDLSLEYNKPAAFGINGSNVTKLQAMIRIEKGCDASDIVIKILKELEWFLFKLQIVEATLQI